MSTAIRRTEGNHQPIYSAGIWQLVLIWLLGGLIGWIIHYLHEWISPGESGNAFPFEIAIGHSCAALFVLLKWKPVLVLSRVRPQFADMFTGLLFGYLIASTTAAILGRPGLASDWTAITPHRKLAFIFAVTVVPVSEEIVYRGTILASLIQKLPIVLAVCITTCAGTVMHDAWLVAASAELLLCTLYVVRGRSLASSVMAHIVANGLIFFPSTLFVLRFR